MKQNWLSRALLSLIVFCVVSVFATGAQAVVLAAPTDAMVLIPEQPILSTPTPLPTPATETMIMSRDQKKALDLLNSDRVKQGLAPLKINAQLSKVAENYAHDMINRDYFSHTSPEGLSPFDRMRKQNIIFNRAGENLAFNVSIAAAQQAFMNSPGHRANVLDPYYTQVGLGVVNGPNGRVYVVQEFSDG